MGYDTLVNVIHNIKNIIDKIVQSGDLKQAKTKPKKVFFALLIPTFLSLFCLTLNGFVDSIFVSESGPKAIIAVGFVQSIFMIVTALGTGLSVAANSYLSYKVGQNTSIEKLSNIVANIIILTLVIGISSSLILCLFLEPILTMLNLHSALSDALVYGNIIFAGNVFFFFSAVCPGILKAGGDISKSSFSLIFTSVLNIVLDYVLIHLWGWGVFGAACATTICSAICAVMLFYYLSKNDTFAVKVRDLYNYDFTTIKKIISYALPVAFESGILSAYAFVINMIFNIFTSTVDFAVFVSFFNIIKFVIIPIIAISEANVTLSSYLYGLSNFKSIKGILKYELKIGLLVSVIIWVLLFIFNNDLGLIYSQASNKIFLRNFTNLFPIYLITLIFMPFGNIGTSILQSIQKYKLSFVVTFVKSVVIEACFALIFGMIFDNTLGIYVGLILGAIIGNILAFLISYIMLNKVEASVEVSDMTAKS